MARTSPADSGSGWRIARAMLLEPPILILDDASAAIDPGTEHEILAAMETAMRGRTTFVVAHRLSTLRRADLVIVLEAGRIVESGTHEQLLPRQRPLSAAPACKSPTPTGPRRKTTQIPDFE